MNSKIIVLLLVSGVTNVFCDDDHLENSDLKISHFEFPKDWSCGLEFAGPMVQLVTMPYIFSEGLFWNQKRDGLLFVDRFNASVNKYHVIKGESEQSHIEELEDTELAAAYPIAGRHDKLILLANNSAYILTKSSNKIEKVFDITDESRILTKSCTTSKGHIFVGTRPANYEKDTTEKGNAEFLLVDLENQDVQVLDDGYTYAGGVSIDYHNKYAYYSDVLENKIWRKQMFGEGKIELVFDLEDYKDVLTGRVNAITLDRDEGLWIAFAKAYQIIRFDVTHKRILRIIPITAPSVTSLTWGGLKFDVLFAGTTSIFISDTYAHPAAGAVISISGLGHRGWYQHHVEVAEDWLD